jgi:hypothetical protein
MFRRTRERFEALEKMIEGLAAKLDRPPAAPPTDAAAVLAQAFGQAAGNSAEMVKALGEIAIHTAAKRMGIRGGIKRGLTGERDERGKFRRPTLRLADRRKCPLCVNPSHPDVTIPMIQEHRRHSAQQMDIEVSDGGSNADGNSVDSSSTIGAA